MLSQVIVCPVRDSPQLTPAEREQKFHICGSFAVKAQLFFVMITVAHLILFQAKRAQPVKTELLPICKPFQICIRLTEEFQLHLLKFTGTEGEVTRCNLITERFADLTNTERNFLAGGSLYIFKVYKNALCSFRSQIYGILCILSHTLEGFEHQVELTDVCEIVLTAGRTRHSMRFDKIHHLLLGPCIHSSLKRYIMHLTVILDQLVRTETLMTFLTIHKRIGKTAQMSGSDPGLRIHQNRTIHTHIVRGLLNKFLPPCFFLHCFSVPHPDCHNPRYLPDPRIFQTPDRQILWPLPGLRFSPLFFP